MVNFSIHQYCILQSGPLLRRSFDGFYQHRQGRINDLFRLDFDDAFPGFTVTILSSLFVFIFLIECLVNGEG